jgi:hypothetical protein
MGDGDNLSGSSVTFFIFIFAFCFAVVAEKNTPSFYLVVCYFSCCCLAFNCLQNLQEFKILLADTEYKLTIYNYHQQQHLI